MKKIILLWLLFCSMANAEDSLEDFVDNLSKGVYDGRNGSTLLTAKKPDDQQLEKLKTKNIENPKKNESVQTKAKVCAMWRGERNMKDER